MGLLGVMERFGCRSCGCYDYAWGKIMGQGVKVSKNAVMKVRGKNGLGMCQIKMGYVSSISVSGMMRMISAI